MDTLVGILLSLLLAPLLFFTVIGGVAWFAAPSAPKADPSPDGGRPLFDPATGKSNPPALPRHGERAPGPLPLFDLITGKSNPPPRPAAPPRAPADDLPTMNPYRGG